MTDELDAISPDFTPLLLISLIIVFSLLLLSLFLSRLARRSIECVDFRAFSDWHFGSLLVFFFTLSKMSYRLGMRGLTIFFSFLFWEWEETVRTGVEREKGSSRQTKKNNTLRSRWESMTCCCGLEETKFLFGVCCNCQASCPIAREEAPLSLSLPRVKEKKKVRGEKREKEIEILFVPLALCSFDATPPIRLWADFTRELNKQRRHFH